MSRKANSIRLDASPLASLCSAVRMTLYLCWIDVRTQFATTPLGTGIASLGYALQVALVGVLFGAILQKQLNDVHAFLIDLALGFAVWNWVSSSLTAATTAPARWSDTLRATALSPAIFVAMIVMRETFVLVQNLILVGLLHSALIGWPRINLLQTGAGLALGALVLLGAGTILAICSLRFRDVMQVVTYATLLGLLLTPILWPVYFLGSYGHLLSFNPLYWLVTTIRAPWQGGETPLHIWMLLSVLMLGLLICAALLYRLTRRRLVYWL